MPRRPATALSLAGYAGYAGYDSNKGYLNHLIFSFGDYILWTGLLPWVHG